MMKTKKAAGASTEEEEESCSRKFGKSRCKNASADNELHYCEKHYKDLELERKKLPPDERRCCKRNGITEGKSGSWRCKNFRLSGHGTKTSNFCEKHYIYHANQHKKVTRGIQPDASDTIIQSGQNVETTQGCGELDILTENPCLITSNKLKRKKELEKMKLPPEEQRCCQNNGSLGWRCKNFRMSHGDDDSVPKSRFCEKHYNLRAKYYEIVRRKKVSEEDDETEIQKQGDTINDTSDTITEGGSANIGMKTDNVETTQGSGELDVLTENPSLVTSNKLIKKKKKKEMEKMKLPPDEQRCSLTTGGRAAGWRCKNFRMGYGAAADDDTLPKSRYCEKHYKNHKNYKNLKKRIRDGEGAGSGRIEEPRGSKRRRRRRRRRKKNVTEEEDDRSLNDTHGETEDFDGCFDSENSLGDLMDMLGMENWNWNKDEMKWKSEADMLSSFEEDPLLLYL